MAVASLVQSTVRDHVVFYLLLVWTTGRTSDDVPLLFFARAPPSSLQKFMHTLLRNKVWHSRGRSCWETL